MRLTNIKPGDIIEWNDGLLNLGMVREKQPGVVLVQPIRGGNRYTVKARQITGHWSKRA